jgi:hypothetical protein
MPHTVEKLLTRATTLLDTSSQLKVCTKSYGLPKSQKSNFRNFKTLKIGTFENFKTLQNWEFQDFEIRTFGNFETHHNMD